MTRYCNNVLLAVLCVGSSLCNTCSALRKFPEGFWFGAATAAYQVEGAWNADGKSESIWDHLAHAHPNYILDQSNGNIADNSYYLYKRDVEMMRELGLDFYRFSISWTRILPSGFPDKINAAGVRYYNNLIDELLKYNIQPLVTIYHWDLPQRLQELGGWTNPDVATWYSDYARTVFKLFGDRVKYFVTINEPHEICYYGYEMGYLAPSISDMKGIAGYMCMKNVLVAHAKAYHIYDKEFRPSQRGNVFISISTPWHEQATAERADVDAARDINEFNWGSYSWPIFSENGDFPPEMKKRIAAKSAEQGFPRSRLPELTPDEIDLVKGSSDFFGMNHYTTHYVYRNQSVPLHDVPSYDDDLDVGQFQLQDWTIGKINRTMYFPSGFKALLKHLKDIYKNPPIFITENGFSSDKGLQDDDRVQYMTGYLNAVLDALEDGSDVRGYTAWSLMDNFEWVFGYTQCFGLYEVDYGSENRTRTARKSAYVYKELLRSRQLDPSYAPDTSTPITIDRGRSDVCTSQAKVKSKEKCQIVRPF